VHTDRLWHILAPAAGDQVATRCPIAKDDAPEFMHDAPFLGVGDFFPQIDVQAAYINLGGEVASYHFSSLDLGRPCLVCVFGTECCISHRFAMPELERRVWQPYAEGKSSLPCVAIARGASASALEEFRKDCAEKQRVGDRHIRQVAMPLVPDPDSLIFKQLAQSIVPRLYLLDSTGKIQAATVGYNPTGEEGSNAVNRLLQEAQTMPDVGR